MKKQNAAFSPLIFLFFIFFATACSTDPEAPSVLQLVSSSGQNYVSENRNVAGGTRVVTGVFAQAPTNNVSLTNFKVTFTYDTTTTPDPKNVLTYLDSTLAPDTKTFAMPVAYTPRNLAHKEIWKFTVTDSDNKTYQKVIRLKTTTTVNKADSRYYTYKDVLLIRLKYPDKPLVDSAGLFAFASATGTSFPAYAVKQPDIAPSIDLIFNSPGIQKPNLSLMGSASLVLTTLTPEGFEGIDNVGKIQSAYPATSGASKLENLTDGQVLAYKTVLNKTGLLRINKVYRTLDSVAIEVKVEK